jgi:hypothetical protein
VVLVETGWISFDYDRKCLFFYGFTLMDGVTFLTFVAFTEAFYGFYLSC